MERSIRLFLCTLLLGPALALAQDEQPAVEEMPAEEPAAEAPSDEATPMEEAAPTEEAVAEEGPSAPSSGFLDVYYVPSSVLRFDLGGTRSDEDGKGFGARGLYHFGGRYAVSGEYQSLTYDDPDIDVVETRLGVGLMTQNESGATAGLFVEYDALKSDEVGDVDGFSVRGRLSGKAAEWLQFYGDVGYLLLKNDFEDLTGSEITLGAVCTFGQFGIFADVRRSQLEGADSGVRSALANARAGLRLSFGG